MKHSQDEINKLWSDWSKPEQRVRSIEAENEGFSAPTVVFDDAVAQVLSVPINDGHSQVVYCRRPGRQWVQVP